LGGMRTDPAGIDLARVGVILTVDGEVRFTAAGAAVAGHPAASVAWLVRRLALDGRGLIAGDIIISGGLTGPTDLEPGMEITLDIDRLGSATLRVE
jgi:2-oxo-3-hexenedioate decarboxylase